ncbi:hypothetical protein BCR32DRAFT_289465 [Anaeromyces robustus]|uniref:Uncharacterized protein n=1 Tax=Anaeromyces robustus TaxID=1754192 RepID=A0A1Y1XN80_9FUNG|nr:hypothetical protein BCR32DRAFT_289465 [Anaeromyces robustus]|eukprot:ORX87208.1 hypothetical protein BCR32DRAFT_289465 [Anaeromyces robustus]
MDWLLICTILYYILATSLGFTPYNLDNSWFTSLVLRTLDNSWINSLSQIYLFTRVSSKPLTHHSSSM